MNEPIRYESIQEPLDEEERELMDPNTWDWGSTEEGIPASNAGAVLRVRFARDEFLALARIARDEGIGPMELIRQTMINRIATDDIREPRTRQPGGTPRAATG